jgi:uncharacterized protein involved in type VI secretion and phage assembly
MSFLDTIREDDREVKGEPVYGVVPAVVTNNKDPEGWGRVKVEIPWLIEGETGWAQVTTLMSGSQRGSFFLPEVGDNVLVAFEHGDINSPYVIGSLWNGRDKPPETNSDGKNNIRKFKSRSGHEFVFDDTDQKEKVEIKTNAGHKIVMDDTAGNEKIEIKDKAGNEIVVKSRDNSITIKCSGKAAITAQEEVVIDSGAIKLGKSAEKTLVNDSFIDLFNNHSHPNHGLIPSSQAVKNVHSTKITKGA